MSPDLFATLPQPVGNVWCRTEVNPTNRPATRICSPQNTARLSEADADADKKANVPVDQIARIYVTWPTSQSRETIRRKDMIEAIHSYHYFRARIASNRSMEHTSST